MTSGHRRIGVDGIWLITAAIARVGFGVFALKLVASLHGLAALGGVGQLLTISALVPVLVSAGIGRGLTTEHARLADDRPGLIAVNRAAFQLLVPAAALLSAVTALAATTGLLDLLVPGVDLGRAPLVVALAMPFAVANATIQAVASAHGRAGQAACSVTGAMVVGGVVVALASQGSLATLAAATLAQPIITTAALLIGTGRLLDSPFALRPDRWTPGRASTPSPADLRRLLLGFGGAMLAPLALNQIGRLAIRLGMDDRLGSFDLGVWESVQRLADGYLLLLGSLSTYLLLPRFAASPETARSLTPRLMLAGTGLLAIGAAVALVVGGPILDLLYTDGASVGREELALVLAGDALRIPFLIASVRLVAERRLRSFVGLEVLAAVTLLATAAAGIAVGSVAAVFGFGAVGHLFVSAVALRSLGRIPARPAAPAPVEVMT